MGIILLVIFLSIFSYILGSIPTALWYGEKYHNADIRTLGSGNAGATNTFRVFGKKAGTIVLAIDAFKGFFATSLAAILFYFGLIDWETCVSLKIIFGFLAIIGHLLPIFCDFKGGKGVATLLGMALCLHPSAAFWSILLFLVIFVISHYVSLASIVASFAFPIMMVCKTFGEELPITIIFGFFVTFLVIYTHRKNIERIFNGTENRMYLFPRNRKSF
ncbi:MAG: Glycerol-3-phosphate 1-O-acyltransferase [Bacteroidota bacterium]|jgi:glycerol-3-phosphate acyltransferase PlsY